MARTPQREATLQRYQEEYERLTEELQGIGYVLPGTLTERRLPCGQPSCRCHPDRQYWHGPYYEWRWREEGKTRSAYLSGEQLAQAREWLASNRAAEDLLKRMRALSLRVARLHEIPSK
ncbi:MAG: DUF6788 family protein [Candidatus Latescibacterota bacterium]